MYRSVVGFCHLSFGILRQNWGTCASGAYLSWGEGVQRVCPPKKRKPSSLYLLSKFVYLTSQLCHSLVMHAFVRKILDPALAFVVFQPVLDSKIHVAQEFNFHSDCVIGLFFCFLS